MPPPSGYENATARTIQLPTSPTSWVNLQGYFPITEEQWALMIGVLNAHKPGLVFGKKSQPQEPMKELESDNQI